MTVRLGEFGSADLFKLRCVLEICSRAGRSSCGELWNPGVMLKDGGGFYEEGKTGNEGIYEEIKRWCSAEDQVLDRTGG